MSLGWLKVNVEKMLDAESKNNGDDIKRACRLLGYCARVENGGVIEGCGSWTRAAWMRCVGCYPIKQGRDAAGLWYWQGDDLVMELYDANAEEQARSIRARRKSAARRRWQGTDKGTDKGTDRGTDRGTAHNVKRSKQSESAMQACNAACNAEENRIDKKEINKEKSDELISLDEAMVELKACHDIVKGRLAE